MTCCFSNCHGQHVLSNGQHCLPGDTIAAFRVVGAAMLPWLYVPGALLQAQQPQMLLQLVHPSRMLSHNTSAVESWQPWADRQGEEGDGNALLAGTACAADAVGVVLDRARHVVVDHLLRTQQ